jgi:hypothetical protein
MARAAPMNGAAMKVRDVIAGELVVYGVLILWLVLR